MKYEEIYSEYLHSEMAIVLEHLKECFIEYYGESNRNKIESVFKNLVIVYYAGNYSKNRIDTMLSCSEKRYKTELNRLLYKKPWSKLLYKQPRANENNLINYTLNTQASSSNNLKFYKNELIEFGYKNLLKSRKSNNNSINIILTMNKYNWKEQSVIESYVEDDVKDFTAGFSCYTITSNNLIGVKIYKKGKIRLAALAHEINHQLQIEYFHHGNLKEKRVKMIGITNDENDLVTEVINEYCSVSIIKIFMKKYNSDLLDLTISSLYFLMDKTCHYIGREVYILLKDEIKSKLINGQARTIKRIIDSNGKENYQLLNNLYNKILLDIIRVKSDGIRRKYKLSEEDSNTCLKYVNKLYNSIEENYKIYLSNSVNSKETSPLSFGLSENDKIKELKKLRKDVENYKESNDSYNSIGKKVKMKK